MKKRLGFLLAAVLLLTALPPRAAQAEYSIPYTRKSVISVYSLTQTQQALVEFLYDPLIACEAEIVLPADTTSADLAAAWQELISNYPELFHCDGYSYSYFNEGYADAVMPVYTMSRAEADSLRQRLYARVQEILRQCEGPEEIHDMLVNTTIYDGSDPAHCYTAVGALLYGRAVCEGYAEALCLMYRMQDIPCGRISGTGNGAAHAWNIAWIEYDYTLIDPTWNDPTGGEQVLRHDYYGLSTSQMGVDHIPDAEQVIPPCTDIVNWYRVRGLQPETLQEAYELLRTLGRDGGKVEMRILDSALYRRIAGDVGAFVDGYNAWCPQGEGIYGSFHYSTNDEPQIVSIWFE